MQRCTHHFERRATSLAVKMFDLFNRPYPDSVMLPLTRSPWPIVSIVFLYLLFILKFGRQFMADRKPFQLQGVLKYYNIGQVIWNIALSACSIYLLFWARAYKFSCIHVLPLDHPLHAFERWATYSYFLNKIVDLMDTIFFVLRKSYKQITVLHVSHHLLMSVGGYCTLRFYGYGGHPYLMGFLNTNVHIVMYSYYYLSSRRKDINSKIWWKKYITIMQLVQFLIIFVHSIWTYNQPSCPVPHILIGVGAISSLIMIIMFTNFYIRAYIMPIRTKSYDKEQ